jgi:hypothetical protein
VHPFAGLQEYLTQQQLEDVSSETYNLARLSLTTTATPVSPERSLLTQQPPTPTIIITPLRLDIEIRL